ncbi:MAG: hypothetical protein CMP51_01860 [Flavobacteriales bacterium]|nr:hypothetical protein [Flavobacteriales bacterium]
MKTKNQLRTGIIVGICVIVLPLILMGTTSTNYTVEKQKTYEIHMIPQVDRLSSTKGYLLNSVTGEVWSIGGEKKLLKTK